MTQDAEEKYHEALDGSIEKMAALIGRIDEIIRDAQIVLEQCQPMETGRIGIVWEAQDILFGKALTPRIGVFKKFKSGLWRYDKVSKKHLVKRAKNKGDFMHDMDITQKALVEVASLFEKRQKIIEKIRVFRLTATLMHQNTLAPLKAIEERIKNIGNELHDRKAGRQS